MVMLNSGITLYKHIRIRTARSRDILLDCLLCRPLNNVIVQLGTRRPPSPSDELANVHHQTQDWSAHERR